MMPDNRAADRTLVRMREGFPNAKVVPIKGLQKIRSKVKDWKGEALEERTYGHAYGQKRNVCRGREHWIVDRARRLDAGACSIMPTEMQCAISQCGDRQAADSCESQVHERLRREEIGRTRANLVPRNPAAPVGD
jgi:hypothetical protein